MASAYFLRLLCLSTCRQRRAQLSKRLLAIEFQSRLFQSPPRVPARATVLPVDTELEQLRKVNRERRQKLNDNMNSCITEPLLVCITEPPRLLLHPLNYSPTLLSCFKARHKEPILCTGPIIPMTQTHSSSSSKITLIFKYYRNTYRRMPLTPLSSAPPSVQGYRAITKIVPKIFP